MANIIIKPIISEKVTALTEKRNSYGFWVARSANKIEIKKAVEKHFNVTVESVNTMVTGGGKKNAKYTNRGISYAAAPVRKKAIVTVKQGD
ncbi:MAG TPA: 50S ribosomal protein L23, partial [Flavobacteriales bacterium]|nr:50S ribosomal protein L23 [Flavobacteriales bacterium]